MMAPLSQPGFSPDERALPSGSASSPTSCSTPWKPERPRSGGPASKVRPFPFLFLTSPRLGIAAPGPLPALAAWAWPRFGRGRWLCYASRADRAGRFAALAAVAACGAARLSVHDRLTGPTPSIARRGRLCRRLGRLYRSPGREPDRDVLFIDVRTSSAGGSGPSGPPQAGRSVRSRVARRPVRRHRRRRESAASVRLGSEGAFRNFGASRTRGTPGPERPPAGVDEDIAPRDRGPGGPGLSARARRPSVRR